MKFLACILITLFSFACTRSPKQNQADGKDTLTRTDASISSISNPLLHESFTVCGTKYRVIEDDSAEEYNLQRFSDGKWDAPELTFNTAAGQSWYAYTLEDVNADGCKDFSINSRYYSQVYFYDPETKDFSDSEFISRNPYLLDTANRLFCDNIKMGPGGGENTGHSDIYFQEKYSLLFISPSICLR